MGLVFNASILKKHTILQQHFAVHATCQTQYLYFFV